MPDKIIKCRDCGQDFAFTEGEQAFFAEKGFSSDPTRCPTCRAARRSGQGSSPRGEREMFPAICARCGKETQVPFQPRSDRPVYCPECYAAQRPGGGDRGRRSGGGGGGYGGGRRRERDDDRW